VKHIALTTKQFFYLTLIYCCLIALPSVTSHYTFRIFYFALSFSSVCYPLIFMMMVLVAELLTLKQTLYFVLLTSMVRLGAQAFLGVVLPQAPHYFWSGEKLLFHSGGEAYLPVVLSFIGYTGAILSIVLLGSYLKKITENTWLLPRMAVVSFVATSIDTLVLLPLVFLSTNDLYILQWKILTFISVKLYFTLLTLPLGYILLLLIQNHLQLKDSKLQTNSETLPHLAKDSSF